MTAKQARTEMMHELERLQQDLNTNWLDQSLPKDWSGLEWDAPVDRHKTRVTLRLDSDMLRWFRKLGPGYGPRINRVLRIYWMGLLSGHIQGFPNDDTIPRLMAEAHRLQREMAENRRPPAP